MFSIVVSGWTNDFAEYKKGAYCLCVSYKLHHTARVNHTQQPIYIPNLLKCDRLLLLLSKVFVLTKYK